MYVISGSAMGQVFAFTGSKQIPKLEEISVYIHLYFVKFTYILDNLLHRWLHPNCCQLRLLEYYSNK